MSGSMNKVILIGNVGNDPEIKSFNNGGKVANFSIATSEKWKDKQSGENKEKTEWHRIAVYGDGICGVVERFVKKGTKVCIEGKLQTRKWADRDGNDKYTTEIIVQGFGGGLTLLGGRDNNGGSDGGSSGYGSGGQRSSGGNSNSNQGGGNNSGGNDGGENFDLDDEIPF